VELRRQEAAELMVKRGAALSALDREEAELFLK
jgi:hypothetical protein